MSRNHIRLDTEQQKEIYERFRYLADRYGKWDVWADFITMSACSLCLSNRQQREEEYAGIARKYKPDEVQRFMEMFALTVEALEANPDQGGHHKMTQKTDYHAIMELKKVYVPAIRGIVTADEEVLIRKVLEIDARNNIELQNIRDMVVMMYSRWSGSLKRADNISTIVKVMDAMSAICCVIDQEKSKRGLPV